MIWLLCLSALLIGATLPAYGDSEADLRALGFLGDEEQVASPTRTPRPVSRIAENVTVITAEQIAQLNVHTLAEILQTVPGIQLSNPRTPGSVTFFDLQGAPSAHVQVLIDGIRQNDLAENNADVGLIPVQQIERIEIVKGAASAAWGQALGGVINVITKSPDPDRRLGGELLASAGERLTTDLRSELSGTVGRFGYYLTGGNLHSDGLLPHNGIDHNNAYGKLVYNLPDAGSLTLGLNYREAARGIFELPQYDWQEDLDSRQLYSFVAFNRPLTSQLVLEVSTYLTRRESDLRDYTIFGHQQTDQIKGKESTQGGTAKLTWGDSDYNLVTGIEYEHAKAESNHTNIAGGLQENTLDRWGGYANGAITFGRFTFLPGLRLDHTGVGSDYLSYTAGLTCRLTDGTVLRSYTANGYSLPYALFDHALQKVWTIQAGVESSDLPYVWLKGTFFYNKLKDVEVADFNTREILLRRQIRQGFEVEGRTIPLYGFTLAGGYTFTDARDEETGERISAVPVHSIKLNLTYKDDDLGLSGALTGNYVWWNQPDYFDAKYTAMIWDLTLTKRLLPSEELSPELFFSVHNLFSGSQYQDSFLQNPGRWLEGGVRWRF